MFGKNLYKSCYSSGISNIIRFNFYLLYESRDTTFSSIINNCFCYSIWFVGYF